MTPVSNERVSDERLAAMLACEEPLDMHIDTLRSVLRELAALRSQSPEPSSSEPVAVKPLQWENGEARSSIGDLYEVASLGGSVWQVRWNGTAFTGWHSSQSEARAAAQADFERRILSCLSPNQDEVKAENDYFGELVERARKAAAKASAKFPQPNYVALKIAEEAGEVVRGGVHYAEGRMEWDEVEAEIVQLLAMLIRFVTEGDEINGIIPPARTALNSEGR